MHGEEAPGWYGKVAMLGDFASRRLAPEWVASCDRWLDACMKAGERALGAGWLAAYLSAPAWRFAWAPGIVDQRWWFGVLMPSCDNVGRYFPLVVAHPRAQAPVDRIGFDHLDLWWAQLAKAAIATLADGATLEAFEAALAQTAPWPGSPPAAARRDETAAGHERYAVAAHAAFADVVRGIAASALLQRLAGSSFWWAWREGEAGACLLQPGLPTPEAFTRMLRPGP